MLKLRDTGSWEVGGGSERGGVMKKSYGFSGDNANNWRYSLPSNIMFR